MLSLFWQDLDFKLINQSWSSSWNQLYVFIQSDQIVHEDEALVLYKQVSPHIMID
jgi:hypothetical protein